MSADVTPELRFEVADLYADYAECLDEQRFAQWPDFFTEDCVYKIVSRENHERGLPLCTVWAESRGMLKDRVTGITQTMMYMPRTTRHVVSIPRIHCVGADGTVGVRASYIVVQTLADEPARLFQAGRYLDTLVRSEGRLRFREKLCIFDNALIDNSLIHPV